MSSNELARRLRASLDRGSGEPPAHQVVEHVWAEVLEGRLETGERMPTVRELAVELGLSPRSVAWAFRELERLGVVSSRPAEGTFVSLSPPPEHERRRRQAFLALCGETARKAGDLGYGVDDLLSALAEYREARQSGGEEDVD